MIVTIADLKEALGASVHLSIWFSKEREQWVAYLDEPGKPEILVRAASIDVAVNLAVDEMRRRASLSDEKGMKP